MELSSYIVVYSETFEQHLTRLKKMFNRLRDAGHTLKTSKCIYAKSKVNLLGDQRIAPNEEKLKAIKEFSYHHKNIQLIFGLKEIH